MPGEEIDSILSAVIIILLMVVVWKWYKSQGSCGQSSMTLSCGCEHGKCRCRGFARVSAPRHRCINPSNCMVCRRSKFSKQEGMNYCGTNDRGKQIGTPGYEPKLVEDDGNYSGETVQQMALEPEVIKSQQDYLKGLGYSGLPQGSSQETVLEETGRSYGTADFVGLTSRKWCKSRQLAAPAKDSRVVPSETIKEWCNIDMNELI